MFVCFISQDVFCSNDKTEPAIVFCKDCRMDFCGECFEVLHKSDEKKEHHFERHSSSKPLYVLISFNQYVMDFKRMCDICQDGIFNMTCWKNVITSIYF